MKSLGIAIIVLIFISLFTNKLMGQKVSYGEVVICKEDKIDYEDFSVRFIGDRKVKLIKIKELILTYYDYEIISESINDTITWSSGLGSIAPLDFEINGNHYVFEKSISQIKGILSEDEIIIWKKDKFKIEFQKIIEEGNKKYG